MASPSAIETQEINLAYLMSRLWAAKFGIVLFVIVITGLVYLFTQVTSPLYRSTAQILIETQETAFTRPEVDEVQALPIIDERDIASEVQVVRSRDVGEQVIRELNLVEVDELDPVRQGVGMVQSILILLGLSEDPMRLSTEERVYQKFARELDVYAVTNSRVIVVSFESKDPELSARIANAVVAAYQSRQRAATATNTRSASSFLETEIDGLRREVSAAEAAVARFRSGSGLLLGPNDVTLSSQRLSELSSELTRARSAESEARSLAEQIRLLIAQQGTRVALPDSFSTPLAQRLQEEQATIRARIAELSATLLPAHPRLRELNAQLADLGGQLRGEAGRIAERFDNEARVAAARAEALQEELARQSADAARIADSEVELRALEREAAAQRDLLASYLVRFREAATRDDTEMLPTNARIIQTAQVEREAVFPQTMPMVIMAFIGSIALALMGVTSHAILAGAVGRDDADEPDPSGRNARNEPWQQEPEISSPPVQLAQQTVLQQRIAAQAVNPQPSPQTALVGDTHTLAQHPLNTMRTYTLSDANECRLLFGHLRRVGKNGAGTRITVGAADGHANAGDMALRMARAMAHAGRSVVMLDCVGDLNAAGISPNGPGFYELVTGAAGFDAALHKDPESPLHFVPSGFTQAQQSMIADDAADLVFSALSESYDSVIVNAGRNPQLLLECANINDAMVLCGDPTRIAALGQTLSTIVSRERILAVQLSAARPTLHAAIPA
ncbi:MAG: Wzz/FepE/Etk N-terminal domain-containing protein [Devosiaceae bacterium]